jgi:hypothetical protein
MAKKIIPIKKISEVQKTLESVADKINAKLFGGTITPYVITIQTKGRKNAKGWASTGSYWATNNKKKRVGYQEVNICAEFLSDADGVYETLVHELCHIWNAQNDIKDCSKSGVHNKKFKSKAESVGLKVEKLDSKGWAYTSLEKNGVAEKLLKSLKLKKDIFTIARLEFGTIAKAKTKMLKWECGCTIVRCAVNLVAVCQECDNEFELAS